MLIVCILLLFHSVVPCLVICSLQKWCMGVYEAGGVYVLVAECSGGAILLYLNQEECNVTLLKIWSW